MSFYPVTSYECERSFSRLRTIKTYLRSTMSEDRQNGLSLFDIDKDIDIDCDYILSQFSLRNPRRMQLINILD